MAKKKPDSLQEKFQQCCDFEDETMYWLFEDLDAIKKLASDGQITEVRQFNSRLGGLQTKVFNVCQARKNRKYAQRLMLCH